MFYFLWCRFPQIIQGYIKTSPHCPGQTSLKNIHNALLVLVTGRNSTHSSQELPHGISLLSAASERLGCGVCSSSSSTCISTSLRNYLLGKKKVWTTVLSFKITPHKHLPAQQRSSWKLSKVKCAPSFSDQVRTTAASPLYPQRILRDGPGLHHSPRADF